MLDTLTATLLRAVNELCGEGKYEVIEENELLSAFPRKVAMDRQGLKKTLDYLCKNGYVDVRYAEDGVYCLCSLPDGRRYSEQVREERSDGIRRRAKSLVFTITGAFLGGFLGSLLAWALITLVR